MPARGQQQQLGEEDQTSARLATEPSAEPPSSAPIRITVGLIPTAWSALEALMTHTRLNRTDVVNRALSVYAMVDENTRKGQELVFRDRDTGKERVVEII